MANKTRRPGQVAFGVMGVRRAATAAAVIAVVVWAARRSGVPESVAGALLALATSSILATLAAAWMSHEGVRNGVAWCCGMAIAVTSLLPAMSVLFPGEVIAAGELLHPGDTVAVPPAIGHARVLVSMNLAEHSSATFVLRAGDRALKGSLTRRTQRVRGGASRKLLYVERTSVLVDAEFGQKDVEISLLERSGAHDAIRIRVFRRAVPLWSCIAAAFGSAMLSGLVSARLPAGPVITAVAASASVGGVLAGMGATPDQAFLPVLVAAALGVAGGLPLGAGIFATMRVVRRRWTRWRTELKRH